MKNAYGAGVLYACREEREKELESEIESKIERESEKEIEKEGVRGSKRE